MMMMGDDSTFCEEGENVPCGFIDFPDPKPFASSSEPSQNHDWGNQAVNVVDLACPTEDISSNDNPLFDEDNDEVFDKADPDLQDFDRDLDERHPARAAELLRTQAPMRDVPVIAPAKRVANEETQQTTSKRPRESSESEPAPKKRKVPALTDADEKSSDYVRMCRYFDRLTFESNMCFNENSVHSVMRRVFETKAAGWEKKLNSPEERASFIESMCKSVNAFERLPFCLLRFIDHLKTQEGRDAWGSREMNFRAMFGDTICRVMANGDGQNRSEEAIAKAQMFMQSLYDSYAWLSFFFHKEENTSRFLCFLLMVVSCIEGRGVYHGRTSKGLSMPHKCYRFMIERLGGHVYPDDIARCADCAERELVETFLSNL